MSEEVAQVEVTPEPAETPVSSSADTSNDSADLAAAQKELGIWDAEFSEPEPALESSEPPFREPEETHEEAPGSAKEPEPEPIPAPAAMRPEEAERFKKLPREDQEWIAAQYKNFQSDYTKKTQSLGQVSKLYEDAQVKPFLEDAGTQQVLKILATDNEAREAVGAALNGLIAKRTGAPQRTEASLKPLEKLEGLDAAGIQDAILGDPEVAAGIVNVVRNLGSTMAELNRKAEAFAQWEQKQAAQAKEQADISALFESGVPAEFKNPADVSEIYTEYTSQDNRAEWGNKAPSELLTLAVAKVKAKREAAAAAKAAAEAEKAKHEQRKRVGLPPTGTTNASPEIEDFPDRWESGSPFKGL